MNKHRQFAHPIAIFFLTLPYGISSGFVSVTLPFILVQHGFSVAAAAAITAVGLSSNLWRFAWAPLTDLTLSLHKWYIIGIAMCAISLFSLVFVPLAVAYSRILMGVVFVSQVAATFVFAPVGGFMAKSIEEGKKGRAAGYAQAGNMGGVGFGGGAGIWLASHLSFEASCTIVSVIMLLCTCALYFVPRLQSDKTQSLLRGFQSTALGVKDLLRSRVGIFTALMVMTPIGAGAAGYMWSSVADDWRVPTDTVALVTGVLSGLVSTIGCIIGGWVADKRGRWWGYFGAGSLMALVTLVMSLAPFSPLSFVSGVLCYALLMGVANAAFCAALLRAIGTHLAATKYALLSSLGNLGAVYMIFFNGWLHDTYNIRAMLLGETLIGIAFVVVFLSALFWFKVVDKLVVDHSLITSE